MKLSRPACLALFVLMLAPGWSAAQDQPAPASGPDTTDEDVAEGATAAPPPQASYPQTALSYGRRQVDTSGTPVTVDETGRSPDRPLSPYDISYDARLRASSAASEGLLGPLDGSWRLSLDGGVEAYAFELSDRNGQVEGAWRDLRRGGLNASGFVDEIQRDETTLTLRFQTAEGLEVATLAAQPDGRWTGDLIDGTRRKPVTLRRGPSVIRAIRANSP